MSGVLEQMPDMEAVMEWVTAYAPTVLTWSALVFAASLALRLLLGLFRRRSVLLRAVNWISFVAALLALGGYWILTGDVPPVVNDWAQMLSTLSLEDIQSFELPQLAHADMTGVAILAGGALLAFLSRPVARIFGGRNDESGDIDLVVKTIGWLLVVLGVLITFGVL